MQLLSSNGKNLSNQHSSSKPRVISNSVSGPGHTCGLQPSPQSSATASAKLGPPTRVHFSSNSTTLRNPHIRNNDSYVGHNSVNHNNKPLRPPVNNLPPRKTPVPPPPPPPNHFLGPATPGKDLAADAHARRQKEIRDLMKKRREKAVLVDRISRWLFPTSFILLNIVYWALFGDHDLW